MLHRSALVFALAMLAATTAAFSASPLPSASPEKLPRWRGFNLLEKFNKGNCTPFREDDFRLIAKLGFNFVRLPMDYRCWIVDGDWEKLNESQLREIDQAVEFGRRHGIHVCLNFHRAPGYTVAKPPEEKSVWTDPDALRVCALHWSAFARRYRGIPSDQLSFNLFNEPGNIPLEQFVPVIRSLVEAIRAEDPQRLIISDGLQWGQVPVPELAPLRIAQATRGYRPGELSHYQASWVGGEKFPLPQWPRPLVPPGRFFGPAKPDVPKEPLVIEGPFAAASTLRLHIGRVSHSGKLVATAGATPLWEKEFVCGPGEGEWAKAEFKPEYNIHQNVYDRDYSFPVPAGTAALSVAMTAGDWLEVTEIGIASSGRGEDVLRLSQAWGKPLPRLRYQAGSKQPFGGLEFEDGQRLWTEAVEPWQKLAASGVGVLVGEWGSFNKTPHDVFLRWAEDCLRNWQRAGLGWALWNFRGSFGVLDSGRADVAYEEFEGHQVDRKLLDLLLKY